ncbi:MAG: hypothetical protein V6Z89_16025 [Desulfobacter sp.]
MTPDDVPAIVYLLATGMVLAELLTAFFRRHRVAMVFLALRTCICLSGIGFILIRADRPPLFGPFEALVHILCVMGILALLFARQLAQPRDFFLYSSVCAFALLALQWGAPMALNNDYYMYADITVLLFFSLRLTAAGIFAHGAVQHVCAALGKEGRLWHDGRNTLLAGACVYLASEWTGSLWCLNWLGDSWQWSHGFLKAAILFLLVMLACHLPAQVLKQTILRAAGGILPGLFILWMIFYH